MSREIKFRAWYYDKDYPEFSYMTFVCSIDFVKRKAKIGVLENTYKFNQIELMQYTGLKDKNGVEIYEGDIVKCGKKIAVVKYGYHNCGCCHDVYGFTVLDNNGVTDAFSFEYCEVIGNIYENKELLND